MPTTWIKPRLGFVLAILLCALSASARAHPGVFATALVKVERNGEVTVTVRADALAFSLDQTPTEVQDPPMHALLDGPDSALAAALTDARHRFRQQFSLELDGIAMPCELLASPTVEDVREWQQGQAIRSLPVRLDFVTRAVAPPGTHSLAISFPATLGDVITTFDRINEEPIAIPIRAGESSPHVKVYVEAAAASDPTPAVSAPDLHPPPGLSQPPPPPLSTPSVQARYFALGFEHILPKGIDHVLFVLGLFLLSPKIKPLLWQVTAFTVAHTITLALTILGAIHVRSEVVEPLIAVSIAFVAIENLITTKVRPWRPAVVFAFGLFHGMGFAGVLAQLGLPRGQLAAALISFNVGVEVAQIAIIAVAWLLVAKVRHRSWYRSRITIPTSIAIALVSGYWTFQRVFA